ncbi:MAG TPA: hypothetical protein VGN95_16000 [Pyrinomonadaceae bacterium]|nr:hypothetical protein [Pyrinomonadaceae bacterium]
MKETLKVINQMVKDGVIEEYAIGGAVAAIYYLEPFDTADLDIFVQVNTPGSDLTILAPIYEYLVEQGYEAKGEFIYIEGLPVQFLPVFNSLTEEAVEKAQIIKYSQVATRIMRPEHLVAIMLDTGRPKDYLRISMFLEHGTVKRQKLHAVLKRHDLIKKWKDNEHRFTR